jgi:hypothetical protein
VADKSAELQQIIELARAFARESEQLALRFDDELRFVWRDWARQIEDLLIQAGADRLQLRAGDILGLRNPLRRALEQAGYNAAAIASVEQASRAYIQRQSIRTTVEALQRLVSTKLLTQGDEAAMQVWRALATSVLTIQRGSPNAIIRDLAKVLDRTEAVAARLFDTELTIFGRQVEALKTEDLGPSQPFMYSGPVDTKTRDWCMEHVGKIYTREAIDGLSNGQLPNVFLTGGGWNCRHVWMAVESQALKDLAGTGQRAEGFDADVARVEALKKERAA